MKRTVAGDVTSDIRDGFGWMVRGELAGKVNMDRLEGIFPYDCGRIDCDPQCQHLLAQCAKALHLSPEMSANVALLKELEAGKIECKRKA